ncbi:hypothetical protein BP00DRAFT_498435 [Aspergillus indologenus CBS 114.80]|uniref:C2H2-type domain-containing protein n=1 Tax=Aspergillus indologenus CBS 114.80 TaxID=1450541 RepID=A0A2V5HW09_9EURO|nr:hypothetical protein BP00DRAFT_498435 [Aspergillus indologenus CBS 114.80]
MERFRNSRDCDEFEATKQRAMEMARRRPRRSFQEPLGTSLITAIRDEFNLCLQQDHLMREKWAVVRMSDFNLWVDGWGAAAATETLLDTRLKALPISDQRCLEDDLNQLKDALRQGLSVKSSEKSMRNVDSLVSQLVKDAVAIRRREADQAFDPRRQQSLREYFECIMLLRPTESALFQPAFPPTVPKDWLRTMPNLEVINLEMTPLQERLIEANLRRRHRFLLAQRKTDQVAQRKADQVASLQISVSESTAGPTDDIAAKSPDAGQYPSPPEAGGDFKCPCCCQELSGTMVTDTNAWRLLTALSHRQHLLKDIQPFTCIAEGCPTPGVLYSTRKDWEHHVEMDHRSNRWVCPVCRDMGTATENVETLLTHMGDHHADAIPQKDAVHVIYAGGFTSYGVTSCPLCKKTGSLDSPELIDHVLRHTHDFALRALPWPKQTQNHAPAPGSRPGTYNMRLLTDSEYVLSWLNDVSEQDPPPSTPPALDLRIWDETAEEPAKESSSACDYFDQNPYFADDSSSRPLPATLPERTEHMSGGEEAIDHQVEGF